MKTAALMSAAVFVATLASTAPTQVDALTPDPPQPSLATEPAPVAQPAEPQPSLAPALRPRREEMAAMVAIAAATPKPTPIEHWVLGYLDAGGPKKHVDLFVDAIIPCESGTAGHLANRRNIDVGYAQINQIHKTWIRVMVGHNDWIGAMLNPYWNGRAAGTLAADSGVGPWYMSKSCWSR